MNRNDPAGAEPGPEFVKLEAALVRAGALIAYPDTPALSVRVSERLAGDEGRPAGWRFLSRPPARVVMAVLAALVLALGLVLAIPDAREALAQFLGLRSIRIIPVTPTPAITNPTPGPTPTLRAGSVCCETTLEKAQQRAAFKLLLPPGESPSQVYIQEFRSYGDAQQIVMVFGDPGAPRFTVYEAQNFVYGKLITVYGKGVGPGTVIQETIVNGERALWLSGAPHILVTLDANGIPLVGTERPVNANTLAWETNGLTIRIETTMSESEAVRLAESLR